MLLVFTNALTWNRDEYIRAAAKTLAAFYTMRWPQILPEKRWEKAVAMSAVDRPACLQLINLI